MDHLVSTVPMLESAIATLVCRWGLSPRRSLDALTEVADELDVDLGDLAVLVLAAELQLQARRAADAADPRPHSAGSRRATLSVVGISPVTAKGSHDVETEHTETEHTETEHGDTSWSMRHPGQVSTARSRRLVQVDATHGTRSPGAPAGLSRRESEIVGLLTLGLSNQEIAQRCYLSVNSVKTYIRTAYRKMGVKSRTQAVLWAVDHGFRSAAPPQPAARGAEPEPMVRPHPLRGLPSLQEMA